MRFTLAVVMLTVLGCSAPDNPKPTSSSAPNLTAKPPGNGWGCVRDRVSNFSACWRPADCPARRLQLAEEMDRRGVAYDISTCADRATAACVTFRLATSSQFAFVCTEVISECEEAASTYKNSRDYADVSDCGAW